MCRLIFCSICLLFAFTNPVFANYEIELSVDRIENDSIVIIGATINNNSNETLEITLPRNLIKKGILNRGLTGTVGLFIQSTLKEERRCKRGEDIWMTSYLDAMKIKIKKNKSYKFSIPINKNNVECYPEQGGEIEVNIIILAKKPKDLELRSNTITI